MNRSWTEEQTKLSVTKQKKALFVILPVIVALLLYIDNLKEKYFVSNMQDVIEEFCHNADYIKFHSSSFCDINSIQIENQCEIYVFSCENEETCLS